MIKISTKFTRFCSWSYLSSYNCFFEICCDAVKNTHCYQFLYKGLKCVSLKNTFAGIVGLAFIGQITFSQNFEYNWNKNVNLRKSIQNYPDKL